MPLGPDDLVLCAGTLANAPVPKRIAAAADAGFRGVSLFTHDIDGCVREGIALAELRARIEGAGLAVAEVDPLIRWFPGASEMKGAFRVSEEAVLAMAEGLAARSITALVMADHEPPRDLLVETFAGLCDRARERGVLVHLEFFPFSQLRTLEAALDIAEAADRPNGGVLLDVWHWFRSGGTLEQVRRAGHRIIGVQLDDAPKQAEDDLVAETMHRRLLPGEGDADAAGVLRALRAGGCAAPLGVEVFADELHALEPAEAARRAFRAAQQLIAAASET